MAENKLNSPNIVRHRGAVTRARREALNGNRSVVLWFTGLPASGKSTIAHGVEERLHQRGCRTYVFDGDNVRHGLCGDLGFSPGDRRENLRRIAEVLKLFLDAGVIALAAFISPFRADRQMVRSMFAPQDFIQVYCRCPLEVCEQREVKGLYRRARAGEIKNYTGISSPYEEPQSPDLVLNTQECSLKECVARVMELLEEKGILSLRETPAPSGTENSPTGSPP